MSQPFWLLITAKISRSSVSKRFFAQKTDTLSIKAYLLDDGSTDGTADAVNKLFSDVTIIQGDGSYFWNEGMRTSFSAALQDGADYYLWLNDDTTLEADALSKLIETHQSLAHAGTPLSIVIGSVKDPETSQLTYGGMRRTSKWHPFHYKLIEPSNEAIPMRRHAWELRIDPCSCSRACRQYGCRLLPRHRRYRLCP